MNESNSKPEQPQDKRRYDPELLKKGLRCNQDQYDMLKRCSDSKNITEWNQWREKNQNVDIFLEGADLSEAHLKSVRLCLKGVEGERGDVYLRKADLSWAKLQSAELMNARLKNARMYFAHLEGTDVAHADLRGAKVMRATVDGGTSLWECKVNKKTDFLGVSLNSAKIDPGTKQLLEYNIRRKNWEEWFPKQNWLLAWFVRKFWQISDYGVSTKRIIYTFFGLAFVFALLYRLFPDFVKVYDNVGDIRGFWHALYFSVVTMTTLGFGDIAANPGSWLGQTLLMTQVILGYILLGALVTRFAVLFTAGGPAGKFVKRAWDKPCPKPKTGWDELASNIPILQTGDIIHVQNRGILSKLILFFSRAWKEEPSWASHTVLVLRVGEEIEIIEALWTTVIRPITAYKGKKAKLLVCRKPGDIDDKQKQKMIEKAEHYKGTIYGFWKIALHVLDRLLNNRYVFRRLIKDNEYPICSWLVAYVYDRILGYQFGVEPNAAQPDDILDHCLDCDWDFIWADSDKSVADLCRTYKLLDKNDVA